MIASYTYGARGNTVRELQRGIDVKSDGIFGSKTAARIADVRVNHGLQYNGSAGIKLFTKLGLKWPSVMRRCLDLTNQFEGTGYGDCNLTDIDGWGLTFGIIGFTSKNGEAQSVIMDFLSVCQEGYDYFQTARRNELKKLISTNADPSKWRAFFYDGKRVHQDVRAALRAWSEFDEMREIQNQHAENKYWNKSVESTKSLGLKSMSAFGLMFDIHVQNGSFRTEHRTKYDQMVNKDMDERAKLALIAEIVAESANPKWKNDVYDRKIIYSRGEGIVHGVKISIIAQAFEI